MQYELDCSLEQSDKDKLVKLIEQDLGFSGFDQIKNVIVVEKGKESIEMYDGESNGVSFFHEVGGKMWHVRVQEN